MPTTPHMPTIPNMATRYHEAFALMRESFNATGPRKVVTSPGEGNGGEVTLFELDHHP